MRGGRFLSCRHGAMGVVHLVVVMVLVMVFIFPEYVCGKVSKKGKKKIPKIFFIILGENLACTFFFSPRMISKIFFYHPW